MAAALSHSRSASGPAMMPTGLEAHVPVPVGAWLLGTGRATALELPAHSGELAP